MKKTLVAIILIVALAADVALIFSGILPTFLATVLCVAMPFLAFFSAATVSAALS